VDFNRTIQFIENSIDEYPPEFKEFYLLIMQHISSLQKDERVEEFDIDFCKKITRELVTFCIDQNTSGKYGQFLEGFCELIFNWNNNLKQDEDIFVYCKCIKVLIASSFIVTKSSDAMKKTLEQLYTYKGWLPPAYDLSIPYLNVLLDEAEGKSSCDLEQNNENSCCGC
jgi:hypothetical protein